MKRNVALISGLALGLSPVLAQAGGEIVAPPAPPPQPVVVPQAEPAAPPPAPAPAPAPDRGGPYVSLFGGASWLTDSEFGFREDDDFFEGDFDDVLGEAQFDTGWVAGAAVGYTADVFGFQPRVELEGAYRKHGVDEIGFDFDRDNDLDDADFAGGDGDLEVASGLVNAWFDVPVAGFRPYVGGGLGVAKVWADDIGSTDVRFASATGFDDSDTAFAWQVGAGVGFDLTDDVTAFVDYRYFNVKDPSFDGEGEFGDDELEVDYNTHNALAGLRFTF